MEKSQQLIKLAQKLSVKYAGMNAENFRSQVENAIWVALRNASGNKTVGVMPFIQMSQQDGAKLNFDVTRNGNDITVSEIVVTPANLGGKYQPLAGQVKNYLEKYIGVYPSQASGININYDNFTINLMYPDPAQEAVARR